MGEHVTILSISVTLIAHFEFAFSNQLGRKTDGSSSIGPADAMRNAAGTLVIDYSPMDCEGETHENKMHHGPTIMNLTWIVSEEICMAICWQLRMSERKCNAVNYFTEELRCVLFEKTADVTKLASNPMSKYIVPHSCNGRVQSHNTKWHPIIEYKPMNCKNSTHYNKLFHGTEVMSSGLANSEHVCASICFQHRVQGYTCNSVNFIRSSNGRNRCELLRSLPNEVSSKLTNRENSIFIEPYWCFTDTPDQSTADTKKKTGEECVGDKNQQKNENGESDQEANSNDPITNDVRPPAGVDPGHDPNGVNADELFGNKITPGSCGQSAIPLRQEATADARSIPWVVRLDRRYGGGYVCAGALVRVSEREERSDIVITAARPCLQDHNPRAINVIAGEPNTKTSRNPKTVYVEEYVPHPSRNANAVILKLNKPIEFSDHAQPICLPDRKETIPAGTNGLVAGWGAQSEHGPLSVSLKRSFIQAISGEECRLMCPKRFSEEMLCVRTSANGGGTCRGDEGAPYIGRGKNGYTIYGVVGVEHSCGKPKRTERYTSTQHTGDWIRSTIKRLSALSRG